LLCQGEIEKTGGKEPKLKKWLWSVLGSTS
jgi:hypothetical protein